MEKHILTAEEVLSRMVAKKPTLPMSMDGEDPLARFLRSRTPGHLLTMFVSRFLKGQEESLPPEVALRGEILSIVDEAIGQELYERFHTMPTTLLREEGRHVQLIAPPGDGRLQLVPLDGPKKNIRRVSAKVVGTVSQPRVGQVAFIEDDYAGTPLFNQPFQAKDTPVDNPTFGQPIRITRKRD